MKLTKSEYRKLIKKRIRYSTSNAYNLDQIESDEEIKNRKK